MTKKEITNEAIIALAKEIDAQQEATNELALAIESLTVGDWYGGKLVDAIGELALEIRKLREQLEKKGEQ